MELGEESVGPSVDRPCGCKGVRSCGLCEASGAQKELHVRDHVGEHSIGPVLQLCADCWRTFPASEIRENVETQSCRRHAEFEAILRGVRVYPQFVSEEEEQSIMECIDNSPWKPSQSGRNKQDYGPRPNFKKRRVKVGSFCGLPAFSDALLRRMHGTDSPANAAALDGGYGLSSFEPVEQCHLDYDPQRGSAIDPHRDDQWLWGEQLVTVNLLSDSVLTFTLEEKDLDVLRDFPVAYASCCDALETRDAARSCCGRPASTRDAADPCCRDPVPRCCNASSPSSSSSTGIPAGGSNGQETSAELCYHQTTDSDSRGPLQEKPGPLLQLAASSYRSDAESAESDALLTKPAPKSVTGGSTAQAAAGGRSRDRDTSHNHSASTRSVCTVEVPMPRHSLLVVEGDARHRWLHAVRRQHVLSRRVAITYRNLGAEFCDSGPHAGVGDQLRLIAKNFSGVPST
eukprot:scpid63218/ scgid27294/ Probable alpha-ketoglutarate-dependent dioxygenase ABH4; Alkylated DNA repair protein alkB homolog 4